MSLTDCYFTERETTSRAFPHKVFVNQLGYTPRSAKRAVITAPCETFRLFSDKGEAYHGAVTHFGKDECSGDDVYVADFSDFEQCGSYTLKTDNGECSLPFSIAENPFSGAFDSVTKAFYYLRCGCGLDEAHAGEFAHAPCHNGTALLWGDESVSLDVSGGWHDAGDYGRYVTAGAVTAAQLLYAFLMFPKPFFEQSLNIPQGGELPDILREVKHELLWLLKMQREDGGVYHKATTKTHAPFIMPENDNAQMYVFPVSSMATADFVAVCALGYRVYHQFDDEFACRLLAAAKKSSRWLDINTRFIGFKNPEGCNTGGYGERSDDDNRFWAWAELYAATGEEQYKQQATIALDNDFSRTELGYGSVGGLGALAYITALPNDPQTSSFKSAFVWAAKSYSAIADKCGYGAALERKDYCWGSNMGLLKHGMCFVIADYIEGNAELRKRAQAQLDYLFGVNATGYSYVTGCGDFCVNYPHLRPSYADGIERCIPGLVSGGANGFPCDEAAKALIPEGTPPMKCFADDVGCYSLNEVTIYWNSPAVFLLAFMNK